MYLKDIIREKRMKKKITGILAFAPIVLFAASIVMMMIFLEMYGEAATVAGSAAILPSVALVIMGVSIVLAVVTAITFIVITFINKDMDASKKILWVIILCLFNMMAFPLYWYTYLHIAVQE